MRIRRMMLLVLGVCGGVIVGSFLIINANNTYVLDRGSVAEAAVISNTLQFPYAVSDTYLIARQIMLYEGPFVEDGTNEYVVDVAAIVLVNTSGVGIENATVVLQWENGEYLFEVQMLPPGETVMVLEKNRQKYVKRCWTDCTGNQKLLKCESAAGKIHISEREDLIGIYNETEDTLKDIVVYFKAYLPENDMYVGGIAKSVCIERLEAGKHMQLRPYGYMSQYGKVVFICFNTGTVCGVDICAG